MSRKIKENSRKIWKCKSLNSFNFDVFWQRNLVFQFWRNSILLFRDDFHFGLILQSKFQQSREKFKTFGCKSTESLQFDYNIISCLSRSSCKCVSDSVLHFSISRCCFINIYLNDFLFTVKKLFVVAPIP